MPEILARHGITPAELVHYNQDSMFLKKVMHLREEIKEKGMTFRLKAKAQAEELLTTSWTIIHSPEVSAAVKAKLIADTVRWGGLEPPKDVLVADGGGGGGVTIQINLPTHTPTAQTPMPTAKVIEHEGA